MQPTALAVSWAPRLMPVASRADDPNSRIGNMERLRIYVDTSVLGGCFDVEFVTWSEALVRDFRAKRLIPVLSDVTAAEVAAAPPRFVVCTTSC